MKNKNKILERRIYIILFTGGYFYINVTIQDNLRTVYKDNYLGRNGWTAACFEESKKNSHLPQMFVLQKIIGNQYAAFCSEIAWAKLLVEKGYQCLNGEKFLMYVEDVQDCDIDYIAIKNADLNTLLSPDKSLFPNYGKIRNSNSTTHRKQLNIMLKKEEHEYITGKAKECNMSKAQYVKQMRINGNIISLNDSAINEYIEELRKGIEELKQIVITIHFLKQYFPNDLAVIQSFADMVGKHYKAMLRLSTDMSNFVMETRKIKKSKKRHSSKKTKHRS